MAGLGDALGLGLLGGALSSFGGFGSSPNLSDVFGAIQQQPQLNPNIPKYPGGGFQAPGGGGFNQGTKTFYDFSGISPKDLNALIKGKNLGQWMPQGFRDALSSGQRKFASDELMNTHNLLPGFLTGAQKVKNIKKSQEPFSNPVASPGSENLFNLGSGFELTNALNNIGNISKINSSLLPSLQGLNLNAFNSANDIIKGGLTSLAPEVEQRIQAAKDAYVKGANIDVNRQFQDSTTGIAQSLANSGFGSSSAGGNIFDRTGRNLADEQTRIATSGQQYGEQLRQDEIQRRLQAFGTLGTVPSFGSGLNTLMSPGLPIQSQYMNPTGQFDFSTLLNQLNNQNQFSLAGSQLKMSPYMAALGPGLQIASQPGIAGAVGSSLGSLAPFAALQGSLGSGGSSGGGAGGWLGGIVGNLLKKFQGGNSNFSNSGFANAAQYY